MNLTVRATILSCVGLFGCGANHMNAARLAGCYSIEVGKFSPAGLVQNTQKPPSMVRLDTTRKDFLFGNELDNRSIGQIVGAGDFFYNRDAAWILQSDTLSVIWSSAFTGAEFRVVGRGSRMQGQLRFFSYEAGSPAPTAPVTFTRQSCK